MKKYKDGETTTTIPEFVQNTLERGDYYAGPLEMARERADNAVEYLAQLTNLLVEKGVIQVEEIPLYRASELTPEA